MGSFVRIANVSSTFLYSLLLFLSSFVSLPLSAYQNRMQQPLAQLYFLTVLEHLQAQKHNLSGLVRIANAITQGCASSDNGEVESVVLWVELQAVLQVVLQELAIHLNPSDLHMGEVEPLKKDINK